MLGTVQPCFRILSLDTLQSVCITVLKIVTESKDIFSATAGIVETLQLMECAHFANGILSALFGSSN